MSLGPREALQDLGGGVLGKFDGLEFPELESLEYNPDF
jgi:hypothetical protein